MIDKILSSLTCAYKALVTRHRTYEEIVSCVMKLSEYLSDTESNEEREKFTFYERFVHEDK